MPLEDFKHLCGIKVPEKSGLLHSSKLLFKALVGGSKFLNHLLFPGDTIESYDWCGKVMSPQHSVTQ